MNDPAVVSERTNQISQEIAQLQNSLPEDGNHDQDYDELIRQYIDRHMDYATAIGADIVAYKDKAPSQSHSGSMLQNQLTPYMYFVLEHRGRIRAENPTLSFGNCVGALRGTLCLIDTQGAYLKLSKSNGRRLTMKIGCYERMAATDTGRDGGCSSCSLKRQMTVCR